MLEGVAATCVVGKQGCSFLWGAKSVVFAVLGGEGSAPGLPVRWYPCGCGMDTAPWPGRQAGSWVLGHGHRQHGSACVSPRRWLAQGVQVLFWQVRTVRRHPLMRVYSSVCWGDRQRDSSPDHAGNTDSTAKEPLVALDVKDPDCEAGAQALADL